MAHDVFVSYSSGDQPFSSACCAALEAHGIRCWIAPRDIMPGQDWSDAIIDAIGSCRLFLLLLSSASNQSEQVKREVQNAVSEAKLILPVRLEDVALSKHMRYFIGTPHWLDALTPPMERHLQKIAETVTSLLVSVDSKLGEDAPGPGHAVDWRPDRVAAIERELRQFIGPFGHALVASTLPVSSGFHDLCQRLSEHIPSEGERRAFLGKCASLILIPERPHDAPGNSDPRGPSLALSPDVLSGAERALAGHIGPLARVLVKRAAREARDPADFHRLLAEHVSSPVEKAAFLRQVQSSPGMARQE